MRYNFEKKYKILMIIEFEIQKDGDFSNTLNHTLL